MEIKEVTVKRTTTALFYFLQTYMKYYYFMLYGNMAVWTPYNGKSQVWGLNFQYLRSVLLSGANTRMRTGSAKMLIEDELAIHS